jgi:hypothetical protein
VSYGIHLRIEDFDKFSERLNASRISWLPFALSQKLHDQLMMLLD